MDTTKSRPPNLTAQSSEIEALRNRLRYYRTRADQLQYALDHRLPIEQAKGILAERYGIDVDEAFAMLRSFCRDHNLKIHDAARALIGQTGEARRVAC
ncbi:ANTAR domain-containing protein [Amycolatopsis sp. NPDC059027]|uniref:ANTAR domain-containing protein n=1 Tax=unclassified Amycolatopsis TaxID=2618356 RepID=UPI003670846E